MALALPQSRTIHVFVIGPPAAGKSTARSFIADWFCKYGAEVPSLGIEEAQRELFPPEKEDGTYFYDEFGALVLNDRDKQIPAALELLTRHCRSAAIGRGFVVELAHKELPASLLKVGEGLLIGALILHISAPLTMRLLWNATRTVSKVPESIVIDYPEMLKPDEIKLIESKGADLQFIDSRGDVEVFRSRIFTVVSRFFAQEETEPSLT